MKQGELYARTSLLGQNAKRASIEHKAALTNRETGGFPSFSEQLDAIRLAGERHMTSGNVDPRLITLNRRGLPAGASETVPSDGGYLIAPEFSQEILKRLYSTSQILSRCRTITLTRPNVNAFAVAQFDESSRANGSRLGGVQAYWQNEADAATATKPRFMESLVQVQKLMGVVFCTSELLADSNALATWLTYALADEMTFKFEQAAINGLGSGQPTGILNSSALVTVGSVGGQSAGTVVGGNIGTMIEALWSESYNNTANSTVWLYNAKLLPQLAALTLTVASGGSEARLWQWKTGADPFDRLAGFPAIQSEYCPVPGATGDIILADFSRYLVVMKQIETALSMHLLFLSDQQAFRATWRINAQPVDRVPVVPLNGSTSTSPFVAIVAR